MIVFISKMAYEISQEERVGTQEEIRKEHFAPKSKVMKVTKIIGGIIGGIAGIGVRKSIKGKVGAVGRPHGSFKHGMPVQQYKKLMSRRKAMIRLRQAQYMQDIQARQQMQRRAAEGIPSNIPIQQQAQMQQMRRMPAPMPPQGGDYYTYTDFSTGKKIMRRRGSGLSNFWS